MNTRAMNFSVVHPAALLRQLINMVNGKVRVSADRVVAPFRREPARLWLVLAIVLLVVFLLALFADPTTRRH